MDTAELNGPDILFARWIRVAGSSLAAAVAFLMMVSCGAAEEPSEVAPVGAPQQPSAAAAAAQPVAAGLSTYAGTGSPQFDGDGGAAAEAGVFAPTGVALDSEGNLYISSDHRVRKVDVVSATITTIAGTGKIRSAGDGGPALEANVSEPKGVAVDRAGNVFVLEDTTGKVRRIDAATGIITTVAGGGIGNPRKGEFGDGKVATEAMIRDVSDVRVDADGNIYIVTDHRVRKVDARTGLIDTIAGTGKRGLGGDGGPATEALLAEPRGVAVDGAGNLFIADSDNHRVRRVDGSTGVMTTLAGIGKHSERGVNFYLASAQAKEYSSERILVDASGAGYAGDGGPAAEAALAVPSGVDVDGEGNVFIADGGIRVRRVDGATGIISTVLAGDSESTVESGKVLVRTGAIGAIVSVVVNSAGHIYLADFKNNLVHRIAGAATQ